MLIDLFFSVFGIIICHNAEVKNFIASDYMLFRASDILIVPDLISFHSKKRRCKVLWSDGKLGGVISIKTQ